MRLDLGMRVRDKWAGSEHTLHDLGTDDKGRAVVMLTDDVGEPFTLPLSAIEPAPKPQVTLNGVGVVKDGETAVFEMAYAVRSEDMERIIATIHGQAPGLKFVLLPSGISLAKVEQ